MSSLQEELPLRKNVATRILESNVLSFSIFEVRDDEDDDGMPIFFPDRERVHFFTRPDRETPFAARYYDTVQMCFYDSHSNEPHHYDLRYLDPITCKEIGVGSELGIAPFEEVLRELEETLRPGDDGTFGLVEDAKTAKDDAPEVDDGVVFTYLFHAWQMHDPGVCDGLGYRFGLSGATILIRAFYDAIYARHA